MYKVRILGLVVRVKVRGIRVRLWVIVMVRVQGYCSGLVFHFRVKVKG